MKNVQPNILPFTVPLTEANHGVAQQFYTLHSDPNLAKQVYLNTLTVEAVHFYLTCMGINTSLEKGMSWQPEIQALINTADLWVESLGRLECCPVLPDMDTVSVSAQTASDRIGYVAVQINESLTEAAILGFVPAVDPDLFEAEASAVIPFSNLQSLDLLPDHLESLERVVESDSVEHFATEPMSEDADTVKQSQAATTRLSEWLDPQTWTQSLGDRLNLGWQAVETLMEQLPEQFADGTLAYSFRQPISSHEPLVYPTMTPSSSHNIDDEIMAGTKLGKVLTLSDRTDDTLLFMVGITPDAASTQMNITVEVYPLETQPYLPQTIHLAVMDEMGKAVLQAEGGNSEGLEFQFSGESGERFSVKVTVQDHSIIEDFQI